MRVTHIITRLIVGGAQENTIASVLGLRERHHLDARLISGPTHGPEGSLEPLLSDAPGVLHLVPSLVRSVHPWHDVRALLRLTRTLQLQSPEIVHTHSGKAGILGRLAAKRAGIPAVVHTIHGPSFGAFQGALANLVFRNAEIVAGHFTTHFVAVAEEMINQYLAVGIGRAEQYSKIYSGFDLTPFQKAGNDFTLRARLGLAPDEIVIGKIARLFRLKGHDDLFAVAPALARRCPRVKFLLIGDGAWRRRFETMATETGMRDRFVFVGLIPPSEVARYVGVMDVVVHLSLREGLPRALPQALAAGRPVVAYDCDGAREVCIENETGYLIRPSDHCRLIECLEMLVKDPGKRRAFGQRGQAFVLQNFSVETMVDALYRLYQRLMPEQLGSA